MAELFKITRSAPTIAAVGVGVLLVLSYVVFLTSRNIYRLYFHPLSHFPGPREAAISHNWILAQSKTGRAEEVFERLHAGYGSQAVRIAPNELHISDVSLYKVIYSQNSPYRKYPSFYAAFGIPHTVFAEDDPKLHKIRRRNLSPFFSKSGILRIEPLMVEKVKILLQRVDSLRKTQSINLYNGFRCVTADIISEYAFARSMDLTITTNNNFHGGFLVAFDAISTLIWNSAYRPLVRKFGQSIPEFIARRLSKEIEGICGINDHARKAYEAYRAEPHRNFPVVWDGLWELTDLKQIVAEGNDILAAGSDTTAFTLSVGICHILSSPEIKRKLVEVLLEAIPEKSNIPNITALEKIPYLQACVRESVRVAKAVPGKLPRVVAKGSNLVVDGKPVPPGTVVGMSAYTMHTSEALWGPDARSFNPDRWMGDDWKSLDQHMVTFSKGSRSCLGMNLAYAEITLVLTYLFRQYEMRLAVGSAGPVGIDNFTSAIEAPGILVDMVARSD